MKLEKGIRIENIFLEHSYSVLSTKVYKLERVRVWRIVWDFVMNLLPVIPP